jgi:hypothetical protein
MEGENDVVKYIMGRNRQSQVRQNLSLISEDINMFHMSWDNRPAECT